jgi:hypothetical protein
MSAITSEIRHAANLRGYTTASGDWFNAVSFQEIDASKYFLSR